MPPPRFRHEAKRGHLTPSLFLFLQFLQSSLAFLFTVAWMAAPPAHPLTAITALAPARSVSQASGSATKQQNRGQSALSDVCF